MKNKKINVMFLLAAAWLSLALAGCSLLGQDSSQVEEQLRDSGINNLQLDFRPDLLDEKLANVEPDENGIFRVTFTEDEVNQMMAIRREDVPPDEAEDLQNLFVRFENNDVLLDSDLGPLFDNLLVARFTPTVENGALQLDLEEASIGAIDVPTQFLNGLESAMNTGMEVLLTNIPAPNTLRDVEIGDGTLTLVAQQNEAQ